MTKYTSNCIVTSGFTRKVPLVFCAVVFTLTVAAVYMSGRKVIERSSRYTATATVCHWFSPEGDASAEWPRMDPANVKRNILARANVERALDQLGWDEGGKQEHRPADPLRESAELVSKDLHVEAGKPTAGDPLKISISYTGSDGRAAIQLVNKLAEDYAAEHRAKTATAAEGAYREARADMDRVREEFTAAKTRFDAFVEEHFGEDQARSARQETASPSPRPERARNPRWVALNDQLARLERLRNELLMDRTPLHPEIRGLDVKVGQLEERLASISKWAEGEQAELLLAPPGLQKPPAEDPPHMPGEPAPDKLAGQSAETKQTFQARKESLKQAVLVYERAAERERQAWQRRLSQPRIDLQLAETFEIAKPAGHRPRVWFLALAAGLVISAGAGMISTGAESNPPFATVASAQATLPVPIVGTIAATGPDEQEILKARSRLIDRRVMIACGLALIVFCVVVLIAVMGIGG